MGRLAERRAEKAVITQWYEDTKRQIHAEYMQDLRELGEEHERRYRNLMSIHRKELNAALEIVDNG